jgi:hypothetical protein
VAVGIRCSDGVVLGVERLLHSKLLVAGSNRRIQSVDDHIGMATAGLLADGKHLGSRARDEAANFHDTYNSPVSLKVRASDIIADIRSCRTGCLGTFRHTLATALFDLSVSPLFSPGSTNPDLVSIVSSHPACSMGTERVLLERGRLWRRRN